MINTGRVAVLWALIATASFATTIPAFSQQPTDAQRSAIRAQCRADYQAHCASVPPGGMASLQCLQKNMSSLAPGCQSAVRAVEAPAEPKADTSKADTNKADTAPAAAKPAAETPAAPPPKAAAAAPATMALRPMRPREELFVLRSACGGDVRELCGGVPAGGGRILRCLAARAASLSPACKEVLAPFAAR
ncbi:MAG: hypothetical protein WA303_11720 [Bradyrhizobium sp.]|jgi:hypothetical protein